MWFRPNGVHKQFFKHSIVIQKTHMIEGTFYSIKSKGNILIIY